MILWPFVIIVPENTRDASVYEWACVLLFILFESAPYLCQTILRLS